MIKIRVHELILYRNFSESIFSDMALVANNYRNENYDKEELIEKKKNLENPEYLLRYARGKYLVTKDDGEQVFKLPEEKEE